MDLSSLPTLGQANEAMLTKLLKLSNVELLNTRNYVPVHCISYIVVDTSLNRRHDSAIFPQYRSLRKRGNIFDLNVNF